MIAALPRLGEKLRGMSGWPARAMAFTAGAVSALGFAPFNLAPLYLAGIAVLVVLLGGACAKPSKLRSAAWIGWAFGFGQFLVGLHWIGYPFLVNPAAHGWQMPFAVLFMCGGLALFFCLASMVAAIFWRPGISRLLLFTAVFAAAEWLRGHIFTGFPWNLAGYSWGGSLEVLQSTSLFGIYGLTLLTILFGASLAQLLGTRTAWRMPAAMTLVFALLWIGGEICLSAHATEFVPGVRLRLVQPNIPQNEKDDRRLVLRNWQRLIDLSRMGSGPAPTHIIWPEAAFSPSRVAGATQDIAALTGETRVLISGVAPVVRSVAVTDFKYFNSLYVFSAGTTLAYDKFHLVPFGEYLPLANVLNALGITKLTAGEIGFSAGAGPQILSIPHAPPAGPLICYEAIFPDAVVASTRPQWFINVTNDAWFGPWAGPRQHFLSARVRAIEQGVPVVRAANTGISAVIDGSGRILSSLALNQMGSLDSLLPKVLAITPYGRFGDFAFFVLLVLSGVGAGVLGRK